MVNNELTILTESRATMAKISAHETTPGHSFSILDFISSTTSNPLMDPLLGAAVFSPVKVGVSSKSTDPSQPCQEEKYNEALNYLTLKSCNCLCTSHTSLN